MRYGATVIEVHGPPCTPALDIAGVAAARLEHEARRHLVTECPSVTYQLLAEARLQDDRTVRQWIKRRRDDGSLVTVEWQGRTLVPSFQFDAVYDPNPEVAAIVKTFTDAGLSSWAVWRWFSVPNPWVGARPTDLIANGDLDAVAAAARRLLESGNTG